MGWLTKLGGRPAQAKAAPTGSSSTFGPTNVEMVQRAFGAPTYAGKSVGEDSALGVAAWWSCARLISESLGMIPWQLLRTDANGNAQPADHPLAELLASPNADQTDAEFRESIGVSLATAGNFYAWTERGSGGRILSAMPMRPRAVRVMRKKGTNTRLAIPEDSAFFRVSDRGKQEDFPRERIWHVKLFGTDPLVGLSPVGAAREALGGALASEEFSNRFFSQGGAPAGVVTYPGWLKEEQREIAKRNLADLIGGLGKAHQFALFEGGIKPEPWEGMSLEDMQFIAGRRFGVVEVCRFMRCPPHLIYELEKASYASIEMMSLEFLTYSLLPYFKRVEASLRKWLLPPEDRSSHILKFNAGALLRATTKERYEAHSTALQNGWLSRNEVRALEDRNAVAGLNEYTVQVNLTPVQELAEAVRGALGDKAAISTLSSGIKELLRLQRLPRKATFNEKGTVIRSEIVDEQLH